MCDPRPAVRQKVPLDGPGPRGLPDCYYTSRTLDSTSRYARFVRKLRAEEDERRRGEQLELKTRRDSWVVDFFTKCDRKSLINDVARRVDICMKSYEEDLQAKRQRLLALFEEEERSYIRLFVSQAQAGAAAAWRDKTTRLHYLLAKRQREHEDKYKDTPLSKCVHVLPCLLKKRAQETALVQLYQMQEKRARRVAEAEFDKMWHELAMKESEALAARMEQDAIERKRREFECKQYSDAQVAAARAQRERERRMLVEESRRYRRQWEDALKEEQEEKDMLKKQRYEEGEARKRFIEEHKEEMEKKKEEMKLVKDTWERLGAMSLEDVEAEKRLIKQREIDLLECNRRLLCMRKRLAAYERQFDHLFEEAASKEQEKKDVIRCRYKRWARDNDQMVREGQLAQIKENQEARDKLKQKLLDEEEYYRQVSDQLKELVEYRRKRDLEHQQEYKQDLMDQIQYNQLLKERAKQEELAQIKKGQLAAEEYKQEIQQMLCRDSYSEAIHPFTGAIKRGLSMRGTCPCGPRDMCYRPGDTL